MSHLASCGPCIGVICGVVKTLAELHANRDACEAWRSSRELLMSFHLMDNGSMKTTVDIPENELRDAMRFTNAKTKREAVVTVLADFNRRRRMAELVKFAGHVQ